jgi:hypothetical protein
LALAAAMVLGSPVELKVNREARFARECPLALGISSLPAVRELRSL